MIIGVDEVGRGAWAGPLVVAAVILKKSYELADSKVLSLNKRQRIFREIKHDNNPVGIAWVSPKFIDDFGLTAAMKNAVSDVVDQIDDGDSDIIIDGNNTFLDSKRFRAVIKADQSVPAVSAASIMAKVARDNFMKKMDILYPGYNFRSNVGYGTKDHMQALKKLGPTNIHRYSFKPIREIEEHHQYRS